MILITDEMKENVEVALADGYSCLLGSATSTFSFISSVINIIRVTP